MTENDDNFDRALHEFIDHTLLKPEATAEQITKLCQEALEYQFKSVCLNPYWVPLAANLVKGSVVEVCTVIGFPLGAITAKVKAYEVTEVIQNGATEVDMVLNIGALRSGQTDVVLNDIGSVVQAAKGKALVKVILETCYLTKEEKIKACELSKLAGANFVKTSTGLGSSGATVEDVMMMRQTVGPEMGVKAAGGVKDYETAIRMLKAGANRLGTSSGVNIIKHSRNKM